MAVVLIAHGSRAEAANEAHRNVCRELAERTGGDVVAAFLELAEPSIPDAIATAATGAARVVVLPYFLYPGRHVAEDIPRFVDQARADLDGIEVVLLHPFGADPRAVDLLATQITDAAT